MASTRRLCCYVTTLLTLFVFLSLVSLTNYTAVPTTTPAPGKAPMITLALTRGTQALHYSRDYMRRKRVEKIALVEAELEEEEEGEGQKGKGSEAALSAAAAGNTAAAAAAAAAAASLLASIAAVPTAPSPAPLASLTPRLLSIDFHISPIQDLKHLLSGHFPGVSVSDRSLSGACGRTGTCANPGNLAVLRQGDVSHSMYFGGGVREEFWGAYREGGVGGDLVTAVDAMVCSHPTGMCELAMPFNRSFILHATTRFEQGRERHGERMGGYVANFRAMAATPGSVVLANNLYDVHYVHYFTGILPRYAPSHCAYPGVSWSWKKGGGGGDLPILVHGYRPHRGGVPLDAFLAPLRSLGTTTGGTGGFQFTELRAALGDNYAYASLAAHPAILHLPYQVSIMSFFEHYRMGIPILAPSLDLLTRWHMDTLFVSERTWDTVLYSAPTDHSALPRHASVEAGQAPFDPNDETNPAAVRWWLQWADYYVFPHVILFDSWEDLGSKLASVDLQAVSAAMKVHSEKQEKELVELWAGIFRNLPSRRDREASDARLSGKSYQERMDAIYGAGKWSGYN